MEKYRNIEIRQEEDKLFTIGLEDWCGKEFRLQVLKSSKKDYCYLVKYLIDFVLDYKPKLESCQTVAFYSWLLRLVNDKNDSFYDIEEVVNDGSGFQIGADEAIRTYNSQKKECLLKNVSPNFPDFEQKIVISKGVYEGLDVEGVRYNSPPHMTGWWLVTDEYDENPDSLLVVHFYHVVFERPDLVHLFALPFGFRFHQTNGEIKVWFDEDVLEET